MRLVRTNNPNTYDIVIEGLEAFNIVKICGDENISINNIDLCYYLEKEGINLFENSQNSRIMIMQISLNYNEKLEPTITSRVIYQNIDIKFPKPKVKFEYIRTTTVEFENEEKLHKWIESESIENYTKPKKDVFGIYTNVLNLTIEQEFDIAKYGGKITSHNGRNPNINA